MQAAKTHLNTAGSHAGGALPSAALRSNHVNGSKSSNRATHGGEESEEDERPGEGHEDARKQRGPHRSNKEAGVAAGAIAEDKMDSKVMSATRLYNCSIWIDIHLGNGLHC